MEGAPKSYLPDYTDRYFSAQEELVSRKTALRIATLVCFDPYAGVPQKTYPSDFRKMKINYPITEDPRWDLDAWYVVDPERRIVTLIDLTRSRDGNDRVLYQVFRAALWRLLTPLPLEV